MEDSSLPCQSNLTDDSRSRVSCVSVGGEQRIGIHVKKRGEKMEKLQPPACFHRALQGLVAAYYTNANFFFSFFSCPPPPSLSIPLFSLSSPLLCSHLPSATSLFPSYLSGCFPMSGSQVKQRELEIGCVQQHYKRCLLYKQNMSHICQAERDDEKYVKKYHK